MPQTLSRLALLVGSLSLVQPVLARGTPPSPYVKDVQFALEQLEEKCGHFFETKGINWKLVGRQFLAEAQAVRTDQEHLVLLVRLLARLEDGHCRVEPLEKGKDVEWPKEGPYAFPDKFAGPGMFWCRSGKKILVRNCWGAAEQSGIEPGMEVLAVDGVPMAKWIPTRQQELADLNSFSTDQQALYFLCTRGLGAAAGSRLKLTVKELKGKKKNKTVTLDRDSVIPVGPVAFPEGVEHVGRSSYGKTEGGFGYIHLRDISENVLEEMDTMLAAIGKVPGLIMDFRANGGGGCDHDALFGRFIPQGHDLRRADAYPLPSAGPNPYGGPIVVIVDAGTLSAGETTRGMLKEDGRAYMIGETPTAGMSSSKELIELPSGLFALYVSVRSNKARFQNGKGIEGLGIQPHEIVEYQQQHLAEGKDTLILRAEQLLQRFPQKAVPYDPKDYGW